MISVAVILLNEHIVSSKFQIDRILQNVLQHELDVLLYFTEFNVKKSPIILLKKKL